MKYSSVRKLVLMYGDWIPSDLHIRKLAKIQPSAEIAIPKTEIEAIRCVRDADVIFGHRFIRQCLPYASRLRWVQHIGGGVDHLPCSELACRNILLSRMTLSAPIIARHAATLAWAITRNLPEAFYRQSIGAWDTSFEWLPLPRRAIVFGTGNIGCALAKILKNDEIEVTGVKRTITEEHPQPFDSICDRFSWLEVIDQMDWCFLALPHTPETKNIFNARAIYALPKHAILINVGRGQTLDIGALCQALSCGHLGGAALDVIDSKLTNFNNPIWQTPRLIITPWIAARYRERSSFVEKYCEEQLTRFVAGQPLLNVVDPSSFC